MGVVSTYIGRIHLYPSDPLFPPSLSIYMNTKNLALPCFLLYCQHSSRFRNINTGERDIFSVIAMEKIKTLIPLPVDLIIPQLPHPPLFWTVVLILIFVLAVLRKRNMFWNYLKIKYPHQVCRTLSKNRAARLIPPIWWVTQVKPWELGYLSPQWEELGAPPRQIG